MRVIENVSEIFSKINVIYFAGLNNAVEQRRFISGCFITNKEPIFSADCKWPYLILSENIADLRIAMFNILPQIFFIIFKISDCAAKRAFRKRFNGFGNAKYFA